MTHITTLKLKLFIILLASTIIVPNALTNPMSQTTSAQFQPQLVHLDHQSVALGWQTEVKTRAVIEFGLDANQLDNAALIHHPHTQHQQTLTDLQPNTDYFYRIRINDLSGKLISISNVHRFTTKIPKV